MPPADRRLPAQVPLHPRVPELPDDRAVREADRHGVVPRGGARFVALFKMIGTFFWSHFLVLIAMVQ